MALPVNIEDLVHGKTVEWERIEFKEGWNPEKILHSLCAFANDFHDWGSSYIILGVEEKDGMPVLPPKGLEEEQIDAYQKEILKLGHKIQPDYFPTVQPYVLDGKRILVLWCPAGDNRIYTAPASLGKEGNKREPYVRIGSSSIAARGETLRQLQELAPRRPFDERINREANIHDLDLALIQAYLQEVKSSLFEESKTMSFADLCRAMHIAKGANEDIKPINAGLLFFSKEPERFFPRAWIELVWHKDNSSENFTEHYFKGALHKQLRDTLSFIQTNIITEKVVKQPGKAEADRFYNFPYGAVEEAIANAVYHKSYELGSPIEVQVWPDKIEILSYPAAMPPVTKEKLNKEHRIIARLYRNQTIGDFLKELHLTERRGTGFPTIYKSMQENSSPTPLFDTDDSTYFLVTLPVHTDFSIANEGSTNGATNGVTNGAKNLSFKDLKNLIAYTNEATNEATNGATNGADLLSKHVHDRVKEILLATESWISRKDLFIRMNLTNQSFNREKYLDPLLRFGWIEMRHPETHTHPEQQYRISPSGKKLLALI